MKEIVKKIKAYNFNELSKETQKKLVEKEKKKWKTYIAKLAYLMIWKKKLLTF